MTNSPAQKYQYYRIDIARCKSHGNPWATHTWKHSTLTPGTLVLDCIVHSYDKVKYSDAVYFVLVSQSSEFIEQIALQINDTSYSMDWY